MLIVTTVEQLFFIAYSIAMNRSICKSDYISNNIYFFGLRIVNNSPRWPWEGLYSPPVGQALIMPFLGPSLINFGVIDDKPLPQNKYYCYNNLTKSCCS